MKALVTGAAGFIGSHLVDQLLADGWQVTGIDAFTGYYARAAKARNIALALDQSGFRLVEADVAIDDLRPYLAGVDAVFHLAARPGVRSSWQSGFAGYLHDNVLGSQRLFDALIDAPAARVVYASSSSVYGNAASYPTPETTTPVPISPYGMTKLATEQLARLYGNRSGVPAIGLRLFTVYGPRQRPDMFFNLLCRAALDGRPVEIFGDGEQSREFTYVEDVVRAFIAAANRGFPGEVYNVGGGSEITVNATIALLQAITGRVIDLRYASSQSGDAYRTAADITKARAHLGFVPAVALEDGLRRQFQWAQAEMLASTAAAG